MAKRDDTLRLCVSAQLFEPKSFIEGGGWEAVLRSDDKKNDPSSPIFGHQEHFGKGCQGESFYPVITSTFAVGAALSSSSSPSPARSSAEYVHCLCRDACLLPFSLTLCLLRILRWRTTRSFWSLQSQWIT